MRTHTLTLVVGLMAAAIGGWTVAPEAQQGGTVAAPFTEAQAAAGETAYAQRCAACHGSTLSGGGEAPALAGTTFMNTWGTHTTQVLFTRTRESMPPENPNGLSDDTYASIIAFLLKANGAQAGSSAFTPATNVPIASIASGQLPASLTAAAAAPARGRGRGGRGRGGADDDSTAPAAPRMGLTVPGTVKNYSPVTERDAGATARLGLADAVPQLRGLELQPAESDHHEERRKPAAEMGVAARRRNAAADHADRARWRDVLVNEYDQHRPGDGRSDGRPDLGASTRAHRHGRAERDAHDGPVRQLVVLSGNRRHVIRARCTHRKRRLEEQDVRVPR